jgi:hypothetical protein
MDQWIPLVSGLAAVITALATLFTVLEMRKQRISSYLPDLFFPITRLYVYRDGSGSFFCSSEEGLSDSSQRNEVYLEILNIGLGAAREIVLEWDCDIDAFVDLIGQLDVDGISKIEHNKGVLKIGNEINFVFNQARREITHVVPMPIEPKPRRVRIPRFYLELYSLYIYHAFFKEEEGLSRIEDPPPLQLSLTYKDIGNKRHELSLNMKADYDMAWGSGGGNGLTSGGGAVLKVERIK